MVQNHNDCLAMDNIKTRARDILDNYLEMYNHRKTPERYSVLEAVFSMPGHFTLKELDEVLRKRNFRVCRATLYNSIRLFVELRLVICHHMADGAHYEVAFNRDSHVHQRCTVCGKITEIEAPEVQRAIDGLRLKRFRRDGYTLYIYGICRLMYSQGDAHEKQDGKRENSKKINKYEYRKSRRLIGSPMGR